MSTLQLKLQSQTLLFLPVLTLFEGFFVQLLFFSPQLGRKSRSGPISSFGLDKFSSWISETLWTLEMKWMSEWRSSSAAAGGPSSRPAGTLLLMEERCSFTTDSFTGFISTSWLPKVKTNSALKPFIVVSVVRCPPLCLLSVKLVFGLDYF